MRKISGQLISEKPVTVARAAKLISRFAAADKVTSRAISNYLNLTDEAFKRLVSFHETHSFKQSTLETSIKRDEIKDFKSEEINSINGDHIKDLKSGEKKKRKKSDGVDSVEEKKRKKKIKRAE